MKNANSKSLTNILLDYGIVIVLILLVVIFSISSDNFFQSNTMFTIMRQVSVTGIISVGMTFVMLTGGIDLSVGSVAGVMSVFGATIMLAGVPSFLAVIICALLGALLGIVNGVCVNLFSIPPLIGTLGVMTSLRGVAYLMSNGVPVYGFDPNFKQFAQGQLGPIPYPVVMLAAIFLIGAYILFKTRTGRYIYGVGGNEEASRLSGIKVRKIKYFVYGVSGLLSGFAGLLLLARTNSGQPSAGVGYEMDAITAVVLGGVSISGGKGNIWLVVVGVLIMGTLSVGMIMNNINDYVQQVIKGAVLIGAVAFAQFSQKVKASNIVV